MKKKLVIPAFKSESEETAWWDKHRKAVEANLRTAMRERRTISLNDVLAPKPLSPALTPITIRLPSEDIAVARQLAVAKGVGYQTYIKLLLHDALRKQAARNASKE